MVHLEKIVEMGITNFTFIGEAGSGKSEIAINFAIYLRKKTGKNIEFFDLDMTKPLFRSRTFEDYMKSMGIMVRYQEQFMDAPSLVGGVRPAMKKKDTICIMDVGGDYIGARSIGGYATLLNQEDTMIYYVLNGYRPWSLDMERIDTTFGQIMGVSHINGDQVHLINNPNIGSGTTIEEFLLGKEKMERMVSPYKTMDFSCIRKDIYEQLEQQENVFPLDLHINLEAIS